MAADVLKSLGLNDIKITETLRNEALTKNLIDVVEQANKINCFNDIQGKLLYHVGTRIKPQCRKHLGLLIAQIMNGNITTETQLSAALEFLLAHVVTSFTEEQFNDACGVGVIISAEQIEQTVADVIAKYKSQLTSDRYCYNFGKLYAETRQLLKWADGGAIKNEVDAQVLLLLGPPTVEELEAKRLGKTKKAAKTANEKVEQNGAQNTKSAADSNTAMESEGASTIEELMKKKVHFHKPGENYKTDGYVVTPNTMHLLKQHLKTTGSKVVTRFPPEPNGILHIGHAKAININFGYAKANRGICYLRFDDTNPEKEEEKFFRGIQDMVTWLGYTPYKITHASDNFDQLYQWAIELIKRGHAYVCHQKPEDIKGFNPPPSPYRERPMGLTMAQVTVDPQMLEASGRDVLNVTAPRAMAVLKPLKIVIENWSSDFPSTVVVPDFPTDATKLATHEVPFDNVLFIDRDDFRDTADKNFKRFASNQPVGLKHVGLVLTVDEIHKNNDGSIDYLSVKCGRLTDKNKPKGFIQWIAQPLNCEIRIYDRLFLHKNPEDATEVPGGFLSDVNHDSLQVIQDAMVDISVANAKVYDHFQFERIGYFSVDPDAEKENR
uniref:Probable glutamine--tRNA ligase n=1 Tax=Romanomermis culicivorax TaxID=13658 RepID=A0A915I770_ROMCU